jgi:uncharacterized protein (TIGR00266 family)
MADWHYTTGSGNPEQASEEQMRHLAAAGTVTPRTLVWRSGMSAWAPAGEAFPQLFGPGATPPPLPPPLPAPSASASAGPARQCHEVDYEIFGDDLQLVEVELDPGETVVAEAGAMNYMEEGIVFETKMGDGSNPNAGVLGKLMDVGKRMLTGESIFMTHFSNGGSGKSRVAFAAPYPGKIIPVDLGEVGNDLLCQKDSFLCAAKGTGISIAFQRRLGAGLFGGEGFILQKLAGDGLVFLHAGGTVIRRELRGEKLRIDTGCIVAFDAGIEYDIERAGNLKSMIFGGEGLFLATLRGHGTVWLQSLPFSRLADRIFRAAPQRNAGASTVGEGSILGGLGNLMDGN